MRITMEEAKQAAVQYAINSLNIKPDQLKNWTWKMPICELVTIQNILCYRIKLTMTGYKGFFSSLETWSGTFQVDCESGDVIGFRSFGYQKA